MPIQTVGGMNQILKQIDAKDWSKSSSIEGFNVNDFSALEVPKSGSTRESFAEMLSTSIAQVNNLQVEANQAMQKLASGENKNIHETMLAVEKAEIAFKGMNQIRMKVIDAYKEVMRMQI
jgi:flagellar hook-basal body complex protein FliE